MPPTTTELIGATVFAVAILHTFSTGFFEALADRQPRHSGLLHLLGEVEVVFGFWAMVLVVAIAGLEGAAAATDYLDSRNFTEPMFVFAIMVIAGSRPILQACRRTVGTLAHVIPWPRGPAFYGVTMFVVPLLGSFITEPAAMTLAALTLRDEFYERGLSGRLKYATPPRRTL